MKTNSAPAALRSAHAAAQNLSCELTSFPAPALRSRCGRLLAGRRPSRGTWAALGCALLWMLAAAISARAACVQITCPADIVTGCLGPNGAVVHFAPDASTTCETTINVICSPPSGSVFPIGTNSVTCVVSDPLGNMARCEFRVIVTNSPPEIVCPPPLTLTVGPQCKAVVPVIPVTVYERCTPSNQLVFTQNPPAGTLLPPGDYTASIWVSEGNHLDANCTVTLHVVDATPPTIKCPGTVKAYCAPDGTNVSFKVEATDTCDGPVAVTCEPPSGSFFPAGSTDVKCTATDSAGNTSECVFNVNVLATPPVLMFLGGSKDHYALPADATSKSACLVSAMAGVPVISQFDQSFAGRWLGHSFENLPGGIETAKLRLRMKPKSPAASNDVLRIGLVNCAAGATWLWSAPIHSLPNTGGAWVPNADVNFSFDLAAMPGNPSSLLPLLDLETTHRLDVAVGDDTVVDWMELSITTCQSSGAAGGVPYLMRHGTAAPGPDGRIDFSSDDRLPFDVDLNIGEADGIEFEVGDWPGATNGPISDCTTPIGSLTGTEIEWKPGNELLCNVKFMFDLVDEYTDVLLTQPAQIATGRAIEVWSKGQLVTRHFAKGDIGGVVLRDDACLLSMGFGMGEFFMALQEPSPVWIAFGDYVSGQQVAPFEGDFIRLFFNIPFTVADDPTVRFDRDLVVNLKGRELDVRHIKIRKFGGLFETFGDGIFPVGDNVATLPPLKPDDWTVSTCYTPPVDPGQWNETEPILLTLQDLLAGQDLKPGAAFEVVATGTYGTTPPVTGEIGRLRCEILSVDPLVTRFEAIYDTYGLVTRLSLIDSSFTESSLPSQEFELDGAPYSISLFVNQNFANFILYVDPTSGDDVTAGGQVFSDLKYAWFRPYQPPIGVHQAPYRFCVTPMQAWENIPITFDSPVPPPPPPAPWTQCVTLRCPTNLLAWSRDGQGVPVRFDVEARSACGSNVTVTCLPPSGSVFPVGVTFVTCQAVDELGYQARRRFPVTVYPVEPRLRIERGDGKSAGVVLFYPAEFLGWRLEGTRQLSSPDWRPLDLAPEFDGDLLRCSMPAEFLEQCFRLRAP